jgi:large subunit ribosomal protein L19
MNYERLQSVYSKNGYPILPVRTGMLIEVHEKVWEGSTERIWKFRGLVIKTKKENHPDGTFTMRWTCSGVTVEKIYPFSFNKFEKVLLLDEYKVRKSKLYYMRNKIWKDARLKSIITADNRDSDLLKKVKTFDAPKAEVKEVKEEKVEAPVEPQAPEAPATEAAE